MSSTTTSAESEYRRRRWVLDLDQREHTTHDLWLLFCGGEGDMTTLDLRHVAAMLPGRDFLPVLGHGTVATDRIQVAGVGYVQGGEANVISVPALLASSLHEAAFEQQRFRVTHRSTGRVIGQARLRGGEYVVDYMLLGAGDGDDAASLDVTDELAAAAGDEEEDYGGAPAGEGGGEAACEWVLDFFLRYHHTPDLGLLHDLRMDHEMVWWGRARRSTRLDVSDVRYTSTSAPAASNCIGISVAQLALDHGLEVVFERQRCCIKDPSTGEVVGRARLRRDDGVYVLDYLRIAGGGQETGASLPAMDPGELAAAEDDDDAGGEEGGAPAAKIEWVLEFFAEHHGTSDLRLLHDLKMEVQQPEHGHTDGGDDDRIRLPVRIDWHGTVEGGLVSRLADVRYDVLRRRNRTGEVIVSVPQLRRDHRIVAVTVPGWCYLRDEQGRDVGRARFRDGRYVLDYLLIGQDVASLPMSPTKQKKEDDDDEDDDDEPPESDIY